MLEDLVVVGLTVVLTEIIKRLAAKAGLSDEIIKQIVVPISVLTIAAGLNALNCYFFGDPTQLRAAIIDGIRWGAVASGVYGLGKAALGKS